MFKLTMMRSLQCTAGIALLSVAAAAQAQWIWVDASGRKQVSDQPPPASVARKNILRAPANAALEEKTEVAAASSATAGNPPVVNAPELTAKAPTRGLSLAEREADYRKRQQDKADADKKASEQSQYAAAKNAHCDNARANKAAMDSGAKIKNGPGRAEFMTDEQRSKESATTERFINENCR